MSFPIPAAPLLHLLLEATGIIVAIFLYDRLRQRDGDAVSDDHRQWLLVAAAFGAFVGSRLVGALEQPAAFLGGGGAAGWLYYFRSKTIVGGLLGGLFAVEATKRLRGLRRRTGDVYVFPLLAAMVIGRVGCFLMGVQEPTHRLPTDFFLGMDLGDGVRRHPTALYEIGFLLLLGLALRRGARRYDWRPGRQFMLFLSAYLGWRFAVGFIQPRTVVAGLGSIQWACVIGLCWYLVDEWLTPTTTTPRASARGASGASTPK